MNPDDFGLHVIGTSHIKESIEKQGLHVPTFKFNCHCIGCESIYKDKELFESVVLAICKDMPP